jgi:hypothetical protein
MLTGQSVQSVRVHVRTGHVAGPYMTRGRSVHTWQVRTGHVAAPGDDTCQADLAFWRTVGPILKVTRVTTGRVTRGTG